MCATAPASISDSHRALVNVLYNYYHQDQLPRGTNLNPSIGGVRPNPAFGNIISTVTDAEIIRHELFVNFSLNLLKPGPTANTARFNWRRLAANGSYSYIRARRNAIGPFDVPATGTLDTEWGHGPADNPYRVNVGITSTQMKDLSVNLSLNASDGFPYTQTTGLDDNQDGLLNDRPAGVGIWMLRTSPVWSLNTRFTYNLPLPFSAAKAGGPTPPRYRASVYAAINNLTNHANLIGFSGVMTSPFFMTATAVQNPRKVDMGFTLSFSSEGLRPSDSPARSLARRFAGALRCHLRRSRGSLASARSHGSGFAPRTPQRAPSSGTYIELPVSSSVFMSLRIQAQPPVPSSENLLAIMAAMTWRALELVGHGEPAETGGDLLDFPRDAREALGLRLFRQQEAKGVHQLSRRVRFLDHAVDDDLRYAHRQHLGRRVRSCTRRPGAARTRRALVAVLHASIPAR